jgi:hypothetical protein
MFTAAVLNSKISKHKSKAYTVGKIRRLFSVQHAAEAAGFYCKMNMKNGNINIMNPTFSRYLFGGSKYSQNIPLIHALT